MVTDVFEWVDDDRRWRAPYDEIGQGPLLLCLPAPSTISTREEMRELAERLAQSHRVVRIDWPGFGDADRHSIRYRPTLDSRYLAAFVQRFPPPIDVIAAGHAAGYLLEAARGMPTWFRRLALLAPTWRGPLPTAMGPHPRLWRALETLVCAPLVGSLVYALNSSRVVVSWMMRRHVYTDEAHLTDALIDARVRIAHRPKARFAAAAFVTGGLDPFHSRDSFLEAARACPAQIFVAIGERTPTRSLAEMKALAALENVRSMMLPGSLGFYDEYPDETASAVSRFLEVG